eukprot:g4719.t1
MEKYTDGGFFKGKNFVFDKRLAVGSKVNNEDKTNRNDDVLSSCKLCRKPWDDYGPAMRCVHCRLLVLVCDDCINGKTDGIKLQKQHLVCDACIEERHVEKNEHNALPRYLHILCLHDNGSSGRLMRHFLRRVESKLKRLVRFHFLDAPINTITMGKNNYNVDNHTSIKETNEGEAANTKKKRRLLRWKWYEKDEVAEKDKAKEYVMQYINDHFVSNDNKSNETIPKKLDGIMGIGQGGQLVDHLLLDLETSIANGKTNFNFGIHLKFYKPLSAKKLDNTNNNGNLNMDMKSYVVPPDVIETKHGPQGTSLFLPVPANSSHLKDVNVIQTLRQYFSKILFTKET